MDIEINELRKRIEKLEQDKELQIGVVMRLMNREIALRAAICALAKKFVPGEFDEHYSNMLDQIASEIPPPVQMPEVWNEVQKLLNGK